MKKERMISISEKELASIIANAISQASGGEKQEAPASEKKPYAGEACKMIRNESLRIKWSSNPGRNKKYAVALAHKFGVVEATASAQVSRLFRSLGRPVPTGIVDNWNK